MTTWTTRPHRVGGGRVLGVSAALALLVVGAVALLGVLTHGPAAAYGALAGGGIAVAVFWTGSAAVDLVAGMMPEASLLVALLTYVLQLVVLAVALTTLTSSGLLGPVLHRGWLVGSMITVTAAWLVAQIVATTRRRIPVYDLPAEGGTGGRR